MAKSGEKKSMKEIPKGYMAIKVGEEGKEKERIVVPVIYLNHPLFSGLLKQAEEEYGFAHKGTITIPCHLDHFRYVQGLIDREKFLNNNHHLSACFSA